MNLTKVFCQFRKIFFIANHIRLRLHSNLIHVVVKCVIVMKFCIWQKICARSYSDIIPHDEITLKFIFHRIRIGEIFREICPWHFNVTKLKGWQVITLPSSGLTHTHTHGQWPKPASGSMLNFIFSGACWTKYIPFPYNHQYTRRNY